MWRAHHNNISYYFLREDNRLVGPTKKKQWHPPPYASLNFFTKSLKLYQSNHAFPVKVSSAWHVSRSSKNVKSSSFFPYLNFNIISYMCPYSFHFHSWCLLDGTIPSESCCVFSHCQSYSHFSCHKAALQFLPQVDTALPSLVFHFALQIF